MSVDVGPLRERLQAISEELADLAVDSLRSAVSEGLVKDPTERVLTRARRAVDKAAAVLSELQP